MDGPEERGDAFEEDGRRRLDILETEAPRRWRLVGELSSEHADRLAAALASSDGDGGDVTLDLTEVTFIDTMGLHVIARTAIELRGTGKLTLEAAKPWVRRVLVLSGIDTIPNVELRQRAS